MCGGTLEIQRHPEPHSHASEMSDRRVAEGTRKNTTSILLDPASLAPPQGPLPRLTPGSRASVCRILPAACTRTAALKRWTFSAIRKHTQPRNLFQGLREWSRYRDEHSVVTSCPTSRNSYPIHNTTGHGNANCTVSTSRPGWGAPNLSSWMKLHCPNPLCQLAPFQRLFFSVNWLHENSSLSTGSISAIVLLCQLAPFQRLYSGARNSGSGVALHGQQRQELEHATAF
jgi:hypothetical protein